MNQFIEWLLQRNLDNYVPTGRRCPLLGFATSTHLRDDVSGLLQVRAAAGHGNVRFRQELVDQSHPYVVAPGLFTGQGKNRRLTYVSTISTKISRILAYSTRPKQVIYIHQSASEYPQKSG